jgi:hypothetical protein
MSAKDLNIMSSDYASSDLKAAAMLTSTATAAAAWDGVPKCSISHATGPASAPFVMCPNVLLDALFLQTIRRISGRKWEMER